MTCIKTGCQIFIEPYSEYAYGDGFRVDRVYVFRLCERSRQPINAKIKHFTIKDFNHWFDEADTSVETNSTMVVKTEDVVDHGYDGISVVNEK